LISNADAPGLLLLDAGPIIALFNIKDAEHALALHGFRVLAAHRARLLVPLPIAFGVYKWLRYHVGSDAARAALDRMRRTMRIEYPGAADFARVSDIANSMPSWNGSLEDALLGHIASTQHVHVWTFNYRDLNAFPNLQFWTPA
jgi:predicted nucleic acid-binding protein